MNKYLERVTNGLFKENPTFVLMLGMCPTLAVTTSAMNGLGMGLSTAVVLIASNAIIAALRKFIPSTVRMPYFIVVVASMVTIVQLLLQAYVPSVNEALGIYIPLIVVNCIIFGRVEAYAAKNKVGLSLFDGIGMGLGFTIALILIGSFREVLGTGAIFGFHVMPEGFEPIALFIKPPGAFLVLAMLTALQNKFKLPSATNGSAKASALACGGDCAKCSGETYATNHEVNTVLPKVKKAEEANKEDNTLRKED